jgi:hypothetical protein
MVSPGQGHDLLLEGGKGLTVPSTMVWGWASFTYRARSGPSTRPSLRCRFRAFDRKPRPAARGASTCSAHRLGDLGHRAGGENRRAVKVISDEPPPPARNSTGWLFKLEIPDRGSAIGLSDCPLASPSLPE